MIWLFFSAFCLGLIFNASPGAVFAESVRRGLYSGYTAALQVQIGSLIGDATWAILGLAGVGLIFQIPTVAAPLTIASAMYLAYLGTQCFRQPPHLRAEHRTEVVTSEKKSAFLSGAALSLTNPANLFFWAALGGAFGSLGVSDPKMEHYMTFFVGFMLSSVLWCFTCAGMIHILHRSLPHKVVMVIDWICGCALLYLAFQSALKIVEKLIP